MIRFVWSISILCAFLMAAEVEVKEWKIFRRSNEVKSISQKQQVVTVPGELEQENSIESGAFILEQIKAEPIKFKGELMVENGEGRQGHISCFDIRMIYQDGSQGYQVIPPSFPLETGKWTPVSLQFTPAKPVKVINVMCLNYGKRLFPKCSD